MRKPGSYTHLVDGRQKSAELKLDESTREKTTRINELKSQIERLQRQLIEGESGIISRINGHTHAELKYNGTDRFPMKFLKELSEIQEQYYNNSDIKWIGRHLEMDAAISVSYTHLDVYKRQIPNSKTITTGTGRRKQHDTVEDQ